MRVGLEGESVDEVVGARERRRVVFASALGTAFEWYDFFLYATLAPFFASLFFPGGNKSAALLSTFAAYAAGFLSRPFGGLIFGRLGDRIGRKYTFLVTVLVMGAATFATGCLPTFAQIGVGAPIMLVFLRLVQGLALGGEYGGAVVYVAEYFPRNQRGLATSWVQTTATFGLVLSLAVVLICRQSLSVEQFASYGWRIPFLCSAALLSWTLIMRLRLQESPVFEALVRNGQVSEAPMRQAFLQAPNRWRVLLALFGACAGQGVVWYTGQYYALFFMINTLHVSESVTYVLLGGALILGVPMFVVFGRLSDRFGRLRFIVVGCALAAMGYFPLFHALARTLNPDLVAWQQTNQVSVAADDCHFHLFVGPWSHYSACDRAKGQLAALGLSFTTLPGVVGQDVVVSINQTHINGHNPDAVEQELLRSGFQPSADPAKINHLGAFAVLFCLVLLVTMVYGPIAALLVGMFPAPIRYTAVSLPYHLGNGWFGGVLPLMAAALVTQSGDIFAGLYYPVAVAAITAVVGGLFIRPRRGVAKP